MTKTEKTALLLQCVFTQIRLVEQGELSFPTEEEKQQYFDELAELAKAVNDKHYEFLKEGE